MLTDVVASASKAWPSVTTTIFVDDMTLEAEHQSERVAIATVAAATDYMIKKLKDSLDLEVSAKKSASVAGKFSMARKIAIASAQKISALDARSCLAPRLAEGASGLSSFLRSGSLPSANACLESKP